MTTTTSFRSSTRACGTTHWSISRRAVRRPPILGIGQGEAIGVRVKPDGINRHVQPVSDRFFYWLRATLLETRRVGYWWAERMLDTNRPLEQKMALFWHGHFATAESKVRDYRKMLLQIETFERHATGNFGDLAHAIARDPAMLSYLDAGVNVKGAANENFAREVMELFTMGVGHYSEKDVREAARAFTGWNFDNLEFVVDPALHDDGPKEFLGRTGSFDGEDVLDIILEQRVTADYIASKIYRFFVRDDPSPEITTELGSILRNHDYALRPMLETMLLSRDFYSEATYGAHIGGPVEHVIALLKHLGVNDIPGIPDFNVTTIALGQHLLNPPSVAGWAQGRIVDHAGAHPGARQRGLRLPVPERDTVPRPQPDLRRRRRHWPAPPPGL